jgi:ribosomal RNA assembly protein
MRIINCEEFQKVIKNKKQLEKKLNIKIDNKEKEISIEGEPKDEFLAEKVIESLNFGFPLSIALKIKKEDFIFEVINIKDYTTKRNLERVRARIIGTKGRTLSTMSNLTECNFELKDNNVGVIGSAENIKNAQNALISLIQGSKQANVYKYLERHRPEPIFDLGLR